MKKSVIGIIIGVTTLIAGISIYYFGFANNEEFSDTDISSDESNNQNDTTNIDAEDKPSTQKIMPTDTKLEVGRKGKRVALLQALFNYFDNAKIKIDGIYGQKTREAVRNHFGRLSYPLGNSIEYDDFIGLVKKGGSNFRKWALKNQELQNAYKKYSKWTKTKWQN